MKRVRRFLLPCATIAVAAAILAGCIYVPGSYQRVGGNPRPESKIGEPGSIRPLQRGLATRDDVVRVLGEPTPTRQPADPRVAVYAYRVTTGWLVGICGIMDFHGDRYLRIEFDADGLLRSYKVFDSWHEAAGGHS